MYLYTICLIVYFKMVGYLLRVALDGLRAFSIILVLLRHGIQAYGHTSPEHFQQIKNTPLFVFMLNGWSGVDFFFVLSGFLIGYHLLSQWPDDEQSKLTFFSRYWGKRILRTFPLYYATLGLVALDLIPLYQHTSTDLKEDLLHHLIFLQDYFGSNLLVSLWSLATEEKFYFFCPFLIWLMLKLPRQRNIAILCLAMLCFIPLTNRLSLLFQYNPSNYPEFFWNVRAPFHMALDGMFFGLLLAFLYQKKLFIHFLEKHNQFIFLSCLLLIVLLLGEREWMEATGLWKLTASTLFILSSLFAILLYTSVVTTGRLRILLSSSPLRFISRLSYSLYLCHMLIIPLSLSICSTSSLQTVNQFFFMTGFFIIYLVLSLVLAIALHIIVERPFLCLKDKIKLKPNE